MNFQGRTVAFHTLGCKLNFAESSTLARLMADKGFDRRPFSEPADVYVINTCSVTENADRECRLVVRTALSRNPEAFVAVIGCYAQLQPNEIAAIPGVDVVLGASEKFKLLDYIRLAGKHEHAMVHNCEVETVTTFETSYSAGDRTRSFLKVQDGCDYSCSFCTIPMARGASRSGSVADVVATARNIGSTGVQEIVLTGVNIGDFGAQPGTTNRHMRRESFFDLLTALNEVENITRFRISSIEPNLLEDRIIKLVAGSPRFARHFHMPLQSGSNSVLARMKRRYRRELYAARVSAIKELMPDCCIGVDVIVGFPGESEKEFLETYNFINELPVSYLHVFTYSERLNTPAASMPEAVPVAERKRRNKMLRILSAKKLRHFYETQIGRTAEVLFEHENRDGFIAGFSSNYVRVKVPFDEALCGALATVRLLSFSDEGEMLGDVLQVGNYQLAGL